MKPRMVCQMRYHLTLSRKASVIIKITGITQVGKVVETFAVLVPCRWDVKWPITVNNILAIFSESYNRIIVQPTIPFLGLFPTHLPDEARDSNKHLPLSVWVAPIIKGQKPVTCHRCMTFTLKILIAACKGLFLSSKRGSSADPCYSIDGAQK